MHKNVFVSIVTLVVTLGAATTAGAAQTDPATHLPLYPGITFGSKATAAVCGTKVETGLYNGSPNAYGTVDRWYSAHLPGFRMIPGKTRPYPYSVFLNADATASVTVRGMISGSGTESIEYHHNPKPAASADNLINWLAGGDPICH